MLIFVLAISVGKKRFFKEFLDVELPFMSVLSEIAVVVCWNIFDLHQSLYDYHFFQLLNL